MKVLILDNYDSFTYNLYQYIGEILKAKEEEFLVEVFRNDGITLGEIREKNYDRIVISPGPGDPSDKKYFGVCSEVLLKLGKNIPVLGVCLGMQGMAYYFGGKVVKAMRPMHGKTSIIRHNNKGVFKGLPQGLEVMRYHSLIADKNSLPDSLEVTATVSDGNENKSSSANEGEPSSSNGEAGEIMGLKHKEYPIEGIQFHPESFATEGGKEILRNFLFQNELLSTSFGGKDGR
jgi:anthranilate synthase component II